MFGNKHSITETAEFRRIRDLPRRTWGGPETERLVQGLTARLKTPQGTETLRPLQAQTLYEAATERGAFIPGKVGVGKTLLSLLLPTLFPNLRRPVIVVPANLVQKTEDARREHMKHWGVSRGARILSYQSIGRPEGEALFKTYNPDLLILDECHMVKNRTAAVTRRVERFLTQITLPDGTTRARRPDERVKVIPMSGTMCKDSLQDFAHLLEWSLWESAPVPLVRGELQIWALALDEKVNDVSRCGIGALEYLADPKDLANETRLVAGRRAFRSRLVETPGVVASDATEDVQASLYIGTQLYDVQPATEENFRKLRQDCEAPDGWRFFQAAEMWACARQEALGFAYLWDPRPPEPWLLARKNYAKFVRETIAGSHSLDSERTVRDACDRGDLDDGFLREWERVRPTFQANQVCRWFDDSALKQCEAWAKKAKDGIIWSEHRFFGLELAKRLGVPYYGQEGKDQNGNSLPEFPKGGKGVIVCSRHANQQGRNLQAWSKMLQTGFAPSALTQEQLIGRLHRPGQAADSVQVDVLIGCAEHHAGFLRALERARMRRDIMGGLDKLLLADYDLVDVKGLPGFRWVEQSDGAEELDPIEDLMSDIDGLGLLDSEPE